MHLDFKVLKQCMSVPPFLEIFSGDSILRPSQTEAQAVRTLSTHDHRDWV